MTTHKIKFTKTPPCSNAEEWASWNRARVSSKAQTIFCDDCTIEYRAKMDAQGLCMSEKLRRNSGE